MVPFVYTIWLTVVVGLAIGLSGCETRIQSGQTEFCEARCKDAGGLQHEVIDCASDSIVGCSCRDGSFSRR